MHLDEVNMILYSCSKDGWISISDVNRCVMLESIEMASQISIMHADKDNMRIFIALEDGNI